MIYYDGLSEWMYCVRVIFLLLEIELDIVIGGFFLIYVRNVSKNGFFKCGIFNIEWGFYCLEVMIFVVD